jgi:hypothetical protein
MLQKTTKSLFMGKYQYKAVLVSRLAHVFREKDLDSSLEKIKAQRSLFLAGRLPRKVINGPKSEEDFTYAFGLQRLFKKLEDFEVRIESPLISFYTNNKKDIDALIKLDIEKIKYISVPPVSVDLEPNTILLPKVPYDFRVTIGKTTQCHDAFLSWADASNNKIKITKSCRRMLQRNSSWGGCYFYVKGDNMLLMVKMHLGSSISKVERVVQTAN